MTRDRALEFCEGFVHSLLQGNIPYLPEDEAVEILTHLSELREKERDETKH